MTGTAKKSGKDQLAETQGTRMRIAVWTLAVLLSWSAKAPAGAPPAVSNATDGVFAAFRSHPLVGLAEAHGWAQQLDFYSDLLRDPRFARDIGNVVLETGSATQQDIVDRHVNGEYVPYAILRKVWADTVGWRPAVTHVGSLNVYATIREVNLTLPPAGRIKVWLGEPPIDWSKIKTKADLAPLEAQRESHPANLIDREILAKNKKALVIYGADHLRLNVFTNNASLRALVEKLHPGSWFIVAPYGGYTTAACTERFERHIKDWPTPALVEPIVGSTMEEDIFQPGCGLFPRPENVTAEQYNELMRDYYLQMGHALLYLGPRNEQVYSPQSPDIYLDLDYRTELERR